MKLLYLLLLSTTLSVFGAEIRSIHTPSNAETAQVFCRVGDVSFSETIRPANLPSEGQAAWAAALGYAGTAVLHSGEAIRSVIFEPAVEGVVIAIDEETGAPTAWRDLVKISISIDTAVQGGPAVRYQSLTSEQLPAPVRDGLLALYATLRSLDRAGLAALGVEP